MEILIPETYVNNTSERLQLYARLDNIKDEDQLKKFSTELSDRFGEIPAAVQELINSIRLRWLGEELGFEKISLKNERFRDSLLPTTMRILTQRFSGRFWNSRKPIRARVK